MKRISIQDSMFERIFDFQLFRMEKQGRDREKGSAGQIKAKAGLIGREEDTIAEKNRSLGRIFNQV